jgi:hypothetical protein
MVLKTQENRKHELLTVRISEYKSFKFALSEIIVPFSEVLKKSSAPDVYSGYEKIPFEKRNPFYKSIMRQEFADEMRSD